MSKYQAQPVLVIFLVAVVIFVSGLCLNNDTKPDDDREEYSYHFGFPTWGTNRWGNSSWRGGWGGIQGFNPFMSRWGPSFYNYYNHSIRPYLNDRCYTSSEGDSCQPGYRSVASDTSDDGVNDKWQCCRNWLW